MALHPTPQDWLNAQNMYATVKTGVTAAIDVGVFSTSVGEIVRLFHEDFKHNSAWKGLVAMHFIIVAFTLLSAITLLVLVFLPLTNDIKSSLAWSVNIFVAFPLVILSLAQIVTAGLTNAVELKDTGAPPSFTCFVPPILCNVSCTCP